MFLTMAAATWAAVVVLVLALAMLKSWDRSADNVSDDADLGIVFEEGTSAWCREESRETRLCHFHNLCYLPDGGHFVFVSGSGSVSSGVPAGGRFPLLRLSSVANHSAYDFGYDTLPAAAASHVLRGARLLMTPAVVFARFHPHNLMHVIHDDLLPLHHTLRRVAPRPPAGAPYAVQLVFTDGGGEGPFHNLYQLFSPVAPLFLHRAPQAVCFADAHVGLSRETTWYDYGFERPQGPLPDSVASAAHIRHFAAYLSRRLPLATPQRGDTRRAVVLSRETNRLMTNEAELSVAMATRLGLRVTRVSLETHSIAEMASALRAADVAVGMHGSLLALALFLPPGAALLELFPFAVPPARYAPYRTLAGLPGMRLGYRAWANTDERRTRPHADAPPHLGGVAHLPAGERAAIVSRREVPPHLCCADPTWLYRIYQDTTVDVPAVIGLMRDAMADGATPVAADARPAHVTHAACRNGTDLTVSWRRPWNVEYFDDASVVAYEVWTQENGEGEYTAWQTRHAGLQLGDVLPPDSFHHVWVRCVVNSTLNGPFTSAPLLCSMAATDGS